jgi:ribosomal protein S27AE
MSDPFANYDNWLVAPWDRLMEEAEHYERAAEQAADESVGHLKGKVCPECGSSDIGLDDFDDEDWRWRCGTCSNGWADDDLITPEDVINGWEMDAAEAKAEAKAEALAEARADAWEDRMNAEYPI